MTKTNKLLLLGSLCLLISLVFSHLEDRRLDALEEQEGINHVQ